MKILFQGDSITDTGRIRDKDSSLGTGYALFVSAELGFEYPEKYEFLNRGIGGNRVTDLYSRIKSDIINLAPDMMSILIGVNDVWHEFAASPNGVSADKYFKIYSMLIEEVKEALPDIKIMILEPFTLRGTANDATWDIFRPEVEKRASMARELAEKYSLPFVPLQEGFDRLSESAPACFWLKDGVHPTAAGHEFIKREWLKAFKSMNI